MIDSARIFRTGLLGELRCSNFPTRATAVLEVTSANVCLEACETHGRRGMTRKQLTRTAQQEALSRAYVQAVAAGAGFTTAAYNIDLDGIDLRIQAGGDMRPALELQLKATVNLRGPLNDEYRFALKKRNYELLRIPTQTPRLLVVLKLPRDPTEWITIKPNELVLRDRAYWVNLLKASESPNKTTVTVGIPKQNLFNIESLCWLMDRSRKGNI